MLNWMATKEELTTIKAIAERFQSLYNLYAEGGKMTHMMDLEAVHCNGCPLDLKALLEAHEDDFTHDCFGIRAHLNRQTGELQDGFVPRYAKNQGVCDKCYGTGYRYHEALGVPCPECLGA